MGLEQKGNPVFCVGRGKSGEWDVCEKGFEKPLASFAKEEDAKKYANDLAKTKEGSKVEFV